MLCAKCGRPVDPDAPYCPYCAADRVSESAAYGTGEPRPRQAPWRQRTAYAGRRIYLRRVNLAGRWWWKILGIAAVLLILTGLIFFLLPLAALAVATWLLWRLVVRW